MLVMLCFSRASASTFAGLVQGLLEEFSGDLVELFPSEVDLQETEGGVRYDPGGLLRTQLLLGVLSGSEQQLHRIVVVGNFVDALPAFAGELLGEPARDRFVPVVASEEDIPLEAHVLDPCIVRPCHGDVECSAAEVVHEHRLPLKPLPGGRVVVRRGHRFRDEVVHLEAGQLSCLLCRRPGVGSEVRRAGDHDVGHFAVDLHGGVLDELPQDVCRDFLWRERFGAVTLVGLLASHELLRPCDRLVGACAEFLLGGVAHEDVVGVLEMHHRGRGQLALAVRSTELKLT